MVHAGVAGVARVNRVCHTHSWRVDRALGPGVARVAVEARRGDGAGLRRQGRNPGSDLRPEVASDPLLPSAINVTAHGIS